MGICTTQCHVVPGLGLTSPKAIPYHLETNNTSNGAKLEFPRAFFEGLQRGGSVQITLVTSPCTTTWSHLGTLTWTSQTFFLLNPAESPKLIPTFFILAVRVVSVALWRSGSGLEVTLSPLVGWLQYRCWVYGFFFFPFFSCYCFSLITTKTSLSQDFLLSIFLLLSFVNTVSPVKAAAWRNDVKNQGHSCIYCTRASLKQLQMARLF